MKPLSADGMSGTAVINGRTFTSKQCFQNALSFNGHDGTTWFHLGCGLPSGEAVRHNNRRYSKLQCLVNAIQFGPGLSFLERSMCLGDTYRAPPHQTPMCSGVLPMEFLSCVTMQHSMGVWGSKACSSCDGRFVPVLAVDLCTRGRRTRGFRIVSTSTSGCKLAREKRISTVTT